MSGVLGTKQCALGARIGLRRVSFLAGLSLVVWTNAARAEEACALPIGWVVSAQGHVDLVRGNTPSPAALNAPLCPGDSVRVYQRSRAAVALSNETTIRLDQDTTMRLGSPTPDNASPLDVCSGALYVITRTPRRFKVTTPFVNANVQGTEFLVEVERPMPPDQCNLDASKPVQMALGNEAARVTVYEGTVKAENALGTVDLASGEMATDKSAPGKVATVRPRDAATWTLYVPTVLDYQFDAGTAPASGDARQRGDPLRSSRIASALSTLEQSPEVDSVRARTQRAGLLLLLGRMDEARKLIQLVLNTGLNKLDSNASDAWALAAVVAVAENDKDAALKHAREALRLNDKSPAAWLALSYAQQADFKIEEALASANAAVDLAPGHALALARVAELYMATGDVDRASAAVRRAVDLDPAVAKSQTVSGFANLARVDTRAAKSSFERAIALDQADPMPRLGLGLAKIREGALEAGRIEIEIATSLDPGNSLIRSYLGKAYFEEKRGKLAASQLQLAEQLDALDPTAWLYDAIRKQAENQPVDALSDLNRSIELNDNRAVYRSRSLIEDDRASRFAATAAIYRELGFEKWAIVESAMAIAANPSNYAAHQELGVAYSLLPKHDIARVSEALQADLRAPVGASPIPLQLSTDNLVIMRESGPTRLGANEFNQLFARDRVGVLFDAVAGNRGTLGDQFILNAVSNQTAFTVAQLHYKTDGFEANSQAEKNIYSIQAKQQLAPGNTIQVELKRNEFDAGETLFSFSPTDAFPLQMREVTESARLGGHLTFGSKADTIWSIASESRERTLGGPDFVLNNDTARTRVVELQHLQELSGGHLVAGLGSTFSRDTFFDGNTITTRSGVVYVYASLDALPRSLSVQLGAALESFKQELSALTQQVSRHRVSPKFGLIWQPQERTTLRVAAFESVKRPLVGSQTLEPTQVSGFNQFFTGIDLFYGDPDGTVSRRIGAAVDHKLSGLSYVGAEVAKRRMAVPSFNLDQDVTWHEDVARLYFYKAIGEDPRRADVTGSRWQFAVSAEYESERIRRPQMLTGIEGIVDLQTDRLPLGVKAFAANGWSASVKTSFVRQRGDFSTDVGLPTFSKRDSAWLTDVAFEYKLGRRLGVLSIGAQNIFDKRIDVIETDPVNPIVAKRRFITVKARLVF